MTGKLVWLALAVIIVSALLGYFAGYLLPSPSLQTVIYKGQCTAITAPTTTQVSLVGFLIMQGNLRNNTVLINNINSASAVISINVTSPQVNTYALLSVLIGNTTYCAEIYIGSNGHGSLKSQVTIPTPNVGNYSVVVTNYETSQVLYSTTLTVEPPPMPTEILANVPPVQGCPTQIGAVILLYLPYCPSVTINYPLSIEVSYGNTTVSQSATAGYVPGYGCSAGLIWNMNVPQQCKYPYVVTATYNDPWGRGSLTTTFVISPTTPTSPSPPPPGVGVVGISVYAPSTVYSNQTFMVTVALYLNVTPSGAVSMPFYVDLFGINKSGVAYSYASSTAYGSLYFTAPFIMNTTMFMGTAGSGLVETRFNVTVYPTTLPKPPHVNPAQLLPALLLLLLLMIIMAILRMSRKKEKKKKRK